MDDRLRDAARRAAGLTAAQREVLRQIHAHRQSKEIARDLGITRIAVDKRVEAAMQRLGVSSRRDAARANALFEQSGDYERFIGEPLPLAGNTDSLPSRSASNIGGSPDLEMEEAAAPYGVETLTSRPVRPIWRGGLHNDLTVVERLGWIAGLAFAILAVVLIALSVSQSISGLFAEEPPTITTSSNS
jgi:DNA-binding CsgD family transcriptional regulator